MLAATAPAERRQAAEEAAQVHKDRVPPVGPGRQQVDLSADQAQQTQVQVLAAAATVASRLEQVVQVVSADQDTSTSSTWTKNDWVTVEVTRYIWA